MAILSLEKLVSRLRNAALLACDGDLTDGQLLSLFIDQQDEAAFEALVKRHGPMVLGVCRRLLGNVHDADDAFQATFLILVHKAGSLQSRELVGNWLYGVAYNTALAAKAKTVRRRSKERQVSKMPESAVTPPDDWSDLRPLLDQELSQLARVYREAIVLCDLEGKTRKEAARKLGIPESTMSGRLTAARRQLAKRLAGHGLALSASAVATILSQSAVSACVPAPLVASTVKAAATVAAGSATAGAVSASVVALTEGVLKTMLLNKVKSVTAVLLALFVVTGVIVGHALAAPVPTQGKPADGNDEKKIARAGDGAELHGQDKKDEPTREELKKEIAGLRELLKYQGTWKRPADHDTVIIEEDRWTWLAADGKVSGTGKLKIIEVSDEKTKVDLIRLTGPNKGSTHKCIMHRHGDDSLKVTGNDDAYPDRFIEEGTFKRVPR